MVKSTDAEFQTFGCQNCGHPYKAYPPDSSYKYAFVNECKETEDVDEGHNRKQGYDCEDCHNRNFLFWCQGHTLIA